MYNETLSGMDAILNFTKTADDAVVEFKSKLAAATTEAEIDALYIEYKRRLKLATSPEDWEMLINNRKAQIRNTRAASPELQYTLSYLVKIADALDEKGFTSISNIIDGIINRIKNGG